MKHLQHIKSLLFAIIILVGFTSCTKDDIDSDKKLSGITVKLKSVFGEMDNLYIEIEDVQLNMKQNSDASDNWISLNAINTGTHNAFDFKEGSELLLVEDFAVESNYIYEIRLVLGHNNFIDVNDALHSLDVTTLGNPTPSNLVKTKLITNRFYDFVIDIDIDKSISYSEDENMMVLNPNIYTEIRQIEY